MQLWSSQAIVAIPMTISFRCVYLAFQKLMHVVKGFDSVSQEVVLTMENFWRDKNVFEKCTK